MFQVLLPECYTEENTSYDGHNIGGDTANSDQITAHACRLSCTSISGAEYFKWLTLESQWGRGHCYCKTSDSGRTDKSESVSGNVNCRGKIVIRVLVYRG